MKAVIIGGGVAGIAVGIKLHYTGWDVVICERESAIPSRGNAFLLHAEGKRTLERLIRISGKTYATLPGHPINRYVLYDETDTVIKDQDLHTWLCMERPAFMSFLYELIPQSLIQHNKTFSHFIPNENGGYAAAAFTDGSTEEGDVFIGADGSRSAVRTALFGPTKTTPVDIKEIIGKVTGINLPTEQEHKFIKRQHVTEKLAFGAIPTSKDSLIWFMQFEAKRHPDRSFTAASLLETATAVGQHFPEEVQSLIASNDFEQSYLWNTTDFDLLPSFHNENAVLIGDAAHLALPFTSAGTTNGLIDAQTLSVCLNTTKTLQQAFKNYYAFRAPIVKEHTALGRRIKSVFLNREKKGMLLDVPLIQSTRDFNRLAPKKAAISIIYITDPICSTCWVVQPQLKKLALEYGNYLEFEYRMGGLLPTWTNFNRGPIYTPSDAAKHWQEIADDPNAMPIKSEIWLNDPLHSSYPPSIAFKAAQLQNDGLAIEYLRQLREHLFIDNINIDNEAYLVSIAEQIGLDVSRFKKDLNNAAIKAFEKDLLLCQQLDIHTFPTFLISTADELVKLEGYQDYEDFEASLQKVYNKEKLQKATYPKDVLALLAIYDRLTTKELAYLTEQALTDTTAQLLQLQQEGKVMLVNKDVEQGIWRRLKT